MGQTKQSTSQQLTSVLTKRIFACSMSGALIKHIAPKNTGEMTAVHNLSSTWSAFIRCCKAMHRQKQAIDTSHVLVAGSSSSSKASLGQHTWSSRGKGRALTSIRRFRCRGIHRTACRACSGTAEPQRLKRNQPRTGRPSLAAHKEAEAWRRKGKSSLGELQACANKRTSSDDEKHASKHQHQLVVASKNGVEKNNGSARRNERTVFPEDASAQYGRRRHVHGCDASRQLTLTQHGSAPLRAVTADCFLFCFLSTQ